MNDAVNDLKFLNAVIDFKVDTFSAGNPRMVTRRARALYDRFVFSKSPEVSIP
jgi:hypothetical protein